MGPGHLAVGFAAKTAAPKILLIFLLVASEALDILSFIFMYLGLEDTRVSQKSLNEDIDIIIPSSISWSHSMLMAIIWCLVFGAIAFFVEGPEKWSYIWSGSLQSLGSRFLRSQS
jgi:membrane-bound metal-dependent hydrolase YbcI (DUF457 family)